MEMLEKVMMWEKRDMLGGFEFCFDLLITDYGIPVAGVIYVELFRSVERRRIEGRGGGGGNGRGGGGERDRVEFLNGVAVQELALFAAFLD